MLSTQHVTQPNPAGHAPARENLGAPETGKFDFLNYILGLQASPLSDENDPAAALFTAGKKGEAEEASAVEKDSQDSSAWNMIFPGLSTLPPVAELGQLKNPALEAQLPTNPLDLSQNEVSSGSSSSKEGAVLATLNANVLAPGEGIPTDNKAARDLAMQKYGQNSTGPQTSTDPALLAQKNSTEQLATPEAQNNNNLFNRPAVAEMEPQETKSRRGSDSKESSDLSNLFAIGQAPSNAATNSVVSQKETAAANAPVQVPEMLQRVDSLVQNGGGKMTVSLNPPHLGQVEIQVTAKGKNVEIEMRSVNQAAKSLIESHVGDLRHSIHSQDLVLSKFDVQVNHESFRSQSDTSFASMQNGSQTFHDGSANSDQTRQSRSFRNESGTNVQTIGRAGSMGSASLAASRSGLMQGRVDVRI